MPDSKVHSIFAGCPPTPFRLQGLVTLLTTFSLRILAGSVSHRQRSWDSPLRSFTSRQVSRRFRLEGPTYRSTCRCSQRQDAGPARQASVTGLYPCRGLRMAISGFSTATIGSSLGVPPSRASREGLDLAFTRSPLSHFVGQTTNGSATGAPESRSTFTWLNLGNRSPDCSGRTTLLGFPHPPSILLHSSAHSIRAMCSPLVPSCITADRQTVFRWMSDTLPELPGSAPF
jgi:hypothetical protein